MKKKKLILKLVVFILSITLLQTPLHALANEGFQEQYDSISQWAIEEVNMANLYSLTHEGLMYDFKNEVNLEQLTYLATNLYGILTNNKENEEEIISYYNQLIESVWEGNYNREYFATRGEVAEVLFNVIKHSAPELEVKGDSIIYLSENEILRGRGDNRFYLDDSCNRQELIAFLKRTYEHVIRETDRASKGYFYKLSGGVSEVYILGSIHIADISIYPFDGVIEEAFNKTDYLAVEADINNIEATVEYIQQKALFYDGTTIDMVLSPETYELYQNQIEAYGFGPDVYNILKPWYAAMVLQNLSFEEDSYDADLGVDLYFLMKAEGKEILEIEGVEFQIDLFDNFSEEIQEMFLLDVLQSIEKNDEEESISSEMMRHMLHVWKQGDVEELETLITATEVEEFSEFNEIFWVERNKHMTEQIISYLNDEDKKVYFVIIGAGHLVGESGIVDDLLERGYSLERVN